MKFLKEQNTSQGAIHKIRFSYVNSKLTTRMQLQVDYTLQQMIAQIQNKTMPILETPVGSKDNGNCA